MRGAHDGFAIRRLDPDSATPPNIMTSADGPGALQRLDNVTRFDVLYRHP